MATFDWREVDDAGTPSDQGHRFSKLEKISQGRPDVRSSIPHLNDLLHALAEVFHSRYIPDDPDRLELYEAAKARSYRTKALETKAMKEYWDIEARKHLASATWLQDTLVSFASKIPVRRDTDGSIQHDFNRNLILAEPGMQKTAIRLSMSSLDLGRDPIFALLRPSSAKRSLSDNTASGKSSKKSRMEDFEKNSTTGMDG